MIDSKDHLHFCAARNKKVALVFFFFCVLEMVLSWRSISSRRPSEHSLLLLFGHIAAVVILCQFFIAFKCIRERIILGFLMIDLLKGVYLQFFPSVLGPTIREADFAMWVLGGFLSLSMLVAHKKTVNHAVN